MQIHFHTYIIMLNNLDQMFIFINADILIHKDIQTI